MAAHKTLQENLLSFFRLGLLSTICVEQKEKKIQAVISLWRKVQFGHRAHSEDSDTLEIIWHGHGFWKVAG